MSEKSIRKNYTYNVLYQLLSIVAPLITTPYLARIFMADGLGLYSFSYSVVQYFSLFAVMGLYGYAQREISYFQDNITERSRVFWELKCFNAVTTSISLAVYLVMVNIYADENYLLYIILSFHIINVFTDIGWFFAGIEEFGKIVLRNTIIRLCDIACTFIFIRHKSDLNLYVFLTVLFNFLGYLSLWLYLPKYIDRPKFKNLKPFRNFTVIFSFFIPHAATLIYTVLDKTMIGIITGNTFENGYYEQAMMIARVSLTIITSMGSVMISRIGYLFAKNEHSRIQEYMYNVCGFVWLLGVPLCLGLIAVSDNFVPWFYGEGFEKVSDLLKISSLLILAVGMNNAIGIQYLTPTGRQNIYTLSIISGAVINFSLNAVLIPRFKSYGAVAASVTAETIIALIELYIVRKELSFKKIIMLGKKYYASGIVMLIALMYMKKFLVPSPMNTLIIIISGAAVYFVMLLILRDELFLKNAMKPIDFIRSKIQGSRN